MQGLDLYFYCDSLVLLYLELCFSKSHRLHSVAGLCWSRKTVSVHLFWNCRLTVQKESIIKLCLVFSEAKNTYGGFPAYAQAGERLSIRGMFNIPLDEADRQNEPEEIRSLSK